MDRHKQIAFKYLVVGEECGVEGWNLDSYSRIVLEIFVYVSNWTYHRCCRSGRADGVAYRCRRSPITWDRVATSDWAYRPYGWSASLSAQALRVCVCVCRFEKRH